MSAPDAPARRLVSIVTPCYNEEGNVLNHFARVRTAIEPFRDHLDFEHIYTDNASHDRTFELLRELSAKHPEVRAMRFSRNIGANRAMYMGLIHARGDAAVLIQADLQDPPELIPEFIRGWEEGYDVVYGQIQGRQEALLMRSLRRLYYKFIARLADVSPPENVGEFRITSRRVLDAIRLYREDDLYLRGAIAHIGYRQKGIPYRRAGRAAGRSSAHLPYLIGYAINALISTSTVAPIRAVTLVGVIVSLAGFGFSAFAVIAKLVSPDNIPHGITTVIALLTFFAGVQLLALGIIGEYIRKIYVQTLRRPPGFVQDRLNLPE